jgi:hypothetical protein
LRGSFCRLSIKLRRGAKLTQISLEWRGAHCARPAELREEWDRRRRYPTDNTEAAREIIRDMIDADAALIESTLISQTPCICERAARASSALTRTPLKNRKASRSWLLDFVAQGQSPRPC